jgi:alpha-tubulin suppressor-like RCC1 family protein
VGYRVFVTFVLYEMQREQVISAGINFSAAVSVQEKVECWGVEPAGVPTAVEYQCVSAICCGYFHVAALLQSGSVICWGNNSCRQSEVPPDLTDVVSISCGGFHTAAVTIRGQVVCWGQNDRGQCDVPPDCRHAVTVSCGEQHTAVLNQDGVIVCWGCNQ